MGERFEDRTVKTTVLEKSTIARESVDDGLVEVKKGAETLRVHPTALKNHLDEGWSKS